MCYEGHLPLDHLRIDDVLSIGSEKVCYVKIGNDKINDNDK